MGGFWEALQRKHSPPACNIAYPAYVALWRAVPAFWRLSAELGDFLKIPGGCRAEFLLPQPFRFIVAFFPQLATMASSGASAADAALASAVLERERARMSLEDVRSWVAQRHFVGSLQVLRSVRL